MDPVLTILLFFFAAFVCWNVLSITWLVPAYLKARTELAEEQLMLVRQQIMNYRKSALKNVDEN